MKRDQELLHKLLLVAEESEPKPDLSSYTEEQQVYHTAILIDSGLVDGQVIRDETGTVAATVMLDLTPKGHDYLAGLRLRSGSNTGTSPIGSTAPEGANPASTEIFISHSKRDEALVAELIEILVTGLEIPRTKIRCTSIRGYELVAGSSIEFELREEINSSRLFFGLLTPNSLQSTYVLFEMGARWGIRKPWFLMFARGASVANLGGPLPAYHVAKSETEEDIIRMLEQVAKLLGVIPQNLSIIQEHLRRTVELAKSPANPAQTATEEVPIESGMDENDISSVLTVWLNNNIFRLNNRVITFTKLDTELHLPPGSSAKYLQRIAEENQFVKTLRRGTATILFEGPEDDR
jgi:hypothetical protein